MAKKDKKNKSGERGSEPTAVAHDGRLFDLIAMHIALLTRMRLGRRL